MEEKIKAKIAAVEGERASYLEAANKQLAAYEGALQVLRQLLTEEATAQSASPSGSDTAAEDVAFAAQAMSEAAESMKAQA